MGEKQWRLATKNPTLNSMFSRTPSQLVTLGNKINTPRAHFSAVQYLGQSSAAVQRDLEWV